MSSEEYHVPERATVDVAQEVLNVALGLGSGAKLTLDASDVEAIDGPAVLVFANIARSLDANGAKVAVKAPTPAFVDGFSDLGLFEDLMKMEFVK